MSQKFNRKVYITACVNLEEHLKFASDFEKFLLDYPKISISSLNVNYYLRPEDEKKDKQSLPST